MGGGGRGLRVAVAEVVWRRGEPAQHGRRLVVAAPLLLVGAVAVQDSVRVERQREQRGEAGRVAVRPDAVLQPADRAVGRSLGRQRRRRRTQILRKEVSH